MFMYLKGSPPAINLGKTGQRIISHALVYSFHFSAHFSFNHCPNRLHNFLDSPFVPPPDEAQLARLGLEESDAGGEGEARGGMHEAPKI